MARRRDNPLSLSFLDAMTCGLGATVLFLMIISGSVGVRANQATRDLRSRVDRLEEEVLEGHMNLVVLRNSVAESDREIAQARGLSRRLLERVEALRRELATFEESTTAQRRHIARLSADLRSLEEGARRLSAAAPSEETPGDRLRAFVGDGDRQYLTGLKVGGERIFILVDASASMLDESIVNVIRTRNLPPDRRRLSRKWTRAIAAVDWLTTRIPRSSRFQIYTFNVVATPVIPGTERTWLDGGSREVLDDAIARLRAVVPQEGTSLKTGLAAIGGMAPRPDNIILLSDSLPTLGEPPSKRRTVTAPQRLALFEGAVASLPRGVPVNVILLPMEGDPMASSAFWKLALATGGSFLSPPADWP